jgi:hypothetical protein
VSGICSLFGGITWSGGGQPRAGREEVVRRRQELKEEIGRHLHASGSSHAPEATIRDLERVGAYPDPDGRLWEISPWFKVETKGLYHRGLEVFARLRNC